MPTVAQHREKAQNNEFFVSSLNNPFWDWAAVGIFYAALQYVEAYLANQVPAIHPGTHMIRDSHIQKDPRLKSLYGDYRTLEDESRDARYDPTATFTQADVTRLQKNLARIKTVVCPLLPQ